MPEVGLEPTTRRLSVEVTLRITATEVENAAQSTRFRAAALPIELLWLRP